MLSSHQIADLERVCDHLVVLATGRVALTGEIDTLLASHRRLTGPRRDRFTLPASQTVIEASHLDKQTTLLVRTDEAILDPAWTVTAVSLDDIVLAYMRKGRDADAPSNTRLAVAR
jgi:ABC-2 type transport system ATP-binding protein